MFGAPQPPYGGYPSQSAASPYQYQQPQAHHDGGYRPPPGGTGYSQQVHTFDTDPHAFARMFRDHLAGLTWNSKPIIDNLTHIAHEHQHNMSVVLVDCLEQHILTSHPQIRLPALYLLDSICKNIGHVYIPILAPRVVNIFLQTYRLVEQPVRMRMEQLLATWQNAGPQGSTLFGDGAQRAIEQSIYGGPPLPAMSPPQPQAPAPSPLQAQAIVEIERLLEIDRIQQMQNPSDEKNSTRIAALSKLKLIVQQAALSPVEMELIQTQLNALSAESVHLAQQQSQRDSPVPTAAGTVASTESASTAHVAPPVVIPLNAPSAPKADRLAAGTSQANDLIKSLMQAGLIGSPSSAAASTPAVDSDEQYVQALRALDLNLTNASLARQAPPVEFILHSHAGLPLQCRQCANRYPEGPKGKASLNHHLDWHFRQNRRAKDSSSRGMSRAWCSSVDDWIRGGHDDTPISTAGGSSGAVDGAAVSAAEQAALRTQHESTFVVAPTDPTISAKPCPICKEHFKSEWSEAEEEWIWRNAIEVEGTYYHASCHYSAKTLSESVAVARGSTPDPGSRANTPGAGATHTPSKADPIARLLDEEDVSSASRKRKESESEESGANASAATEQEQAEPPKKRQATEEIVVGFLKETTEETAGEAARAAAAETATEAVGEPAGEAVGEAVGESAGP